MTSSDLFPALRLTTNTSDELRRAIPTPLAIVVGLYVLEILFHLFDIAVHEATAFNVPRIVWSVILVALLVRGNEGARAFVQAAALFSGAVGITMVLATLASGGILMMVVGMVWISLGAFTYWALATQSVETWMASRTLARLS